MSSFQTDRMTLHGSLTSRQTRFEVLVFPHLDRLVAFAARQVGNAADAEDAVQEACIRAWRGFDQLRDEDRVRSWLYQILRTTVCDLREREGRRERLAPMESLTQNDLPVGDEAGPFEHLVGALSREQATRLLEAIPAEFATAIQLHDLEDFGYQEIAEMTGVPIGTVMSRIYRGRKLMAAIIATQSASWETAEWRLSTSGALSQKRKA